MIIGEEIKALGLISDLDDKSLRAVSYDLRVGEIVTADGKVHKSHILKRQGIVKVISKESISLPCDIGGTVIVKTGLSERGLMAINIGIIDPSYSGKISSYIVNFSDDDQLIDEGDNFLRSTFVKLSSESKYTKNITISDSDYLKKSRQHMITGFSDSFLNSEKIIQDFLKESMTKYRNQILGYVSLAGFVLAILVLFLNFGNLFIVHRWLDPQAALKGNFDREITSDQADLRQENIELRSNLEKVQSRLKKLEAKR